MRSSSIVAHRAAGEPPAPVVQPEVMPLPLDLTLAVLDPDVVNTLVRAIDSHRLATLRAQCNGSQTVAESAGELRRLRAAKDALTTPAQQPRRNP